MTNDHINMSKHGALKGPKACMAACNYEGSSRRLRPGEGAVESHAAAWEDETDKRIALSGNDDVEKSCANRLSSNLLESTLWSLW